MAILKESYSLAEITELWKSGEQLELGEKMKEQIRQNAGFLKQYLSKAERPIYGINTGFGSLQNVAVPENELHELQRNLLITHAAGTGEFLPDALVRLMMLLKILNISKAHSAVRVEVAERLIFLYNSGYTPLVHEQGSLGASGDLAPLAEMCLPLIGMGKIRDKKGHLSEAETVLKKHDLQALVLDPKEALALINGTQFMLSHAICCYAESQKILQKINVIAAASADVYLCRKEPFYPQLHHIRPHAGQIKTAAEIYEYLGESALQKSERPAVQDPYSFRCVPQVHGASIDALNYCFSVWETELNGVTDNPTVFEKDELILSGGNFHGQPLALTLDFAAMALAELANISERRTYLLISGQRHLPAFLSPNPGTDSGYMIAQYTAASMVSQNKQLCMPASVDSIMSSNGQEDHVSMGSNAGIKLLKVVKNVQQVIAIEALCAAQAANFRTTDSFWAAEDLFKKLQIDSHKHMHVAMHEIISEVAEKIWE